MRERLRERVQAARLKLEARIADSGALNTGRADSHCGQHERGKRSSRRSTLCAVCQYGTVPAASLAIILALLLGAIVWINGDDLKTMLRAAGWTTAVAAA